MELRHLKYLIAVAEELHFGHAAARLHISQPPLSQQIRQIEIELGLQLFHRTKREVHLTDAGRRVVNEAYQVLARVDHFSRVAAQAGEGEIGHLSVGVPGGVNEILVRTLRTLKNSSPGVRVELQYMSTGSQIEALRERKIDVGFVGLPLRDPLLMLEKISAKPLYLALPIDHSLAKLSEIPITRLQNQAMILFPRRVTPGLHDSITAVCRNAGFTLNVIHEVDSISGALTLVRAGFGLAFTTPGDQQVWPDIVFRPVSGGVSLEQAVAYRRDSVTPVLETFLTAVRKFVRTAAPTKRASKP